MSAPFDFAPLHPRAALADSFGAPMDLSPGPDVRSAAYEAGLEEGRAASAAAASAMHQAVVALTATRDELAAEMERQAVELALKIAEQALHAAITADPALVLEAVRGALRLLVEREHVTVVVAPDDMELVRESADQLQSELGGLDHLEIQSDRRVPSGGAIVRTVEGEVDATLETKLQRAREVLERELANA